MKYKINFLTILLLPLIVLLVANVFVAVDSSVRGARLMAIEKQINEIEEQNKRLTDVLISHTSLSEVIQSSQDLGFNQPEETLYLTTQVPVAWKQD